MFRCWGHAMLQIHIFFFAWSSRVKSGPLAVVVFHRWNSKSHSSFPSFSNIISRSHRSLYQTISPPTSFYSFAQATALIISALLCLSTSTCCLPRPCTQQQDVQWFHLFSGIVYKVHLEPILSLLSRILSAPFVLASSWLRISSFHVSLGTTRDDIRLLVLCRIGFAIPLSWSFRFSWIPLLSANMSSLSATLVSIHFVHQSPHCQVLSISPQSASHSNFLHRLHQFYNDYILLLDCLSFLCSFNPSIDQLGHVAGDTQSCLVGCNWYNLHVYSLDEIGVIEFSVCCHFHPLQYLFLHSFNHSFCLDATSLFNPQEFIDFVSSGSMVFILSSNTWRPSPLIILPCSNVISAHLDTP